MIQKCSVDFYTEPINGISINTSLMCNPSNYTSCSFRNIKFIVIHYTGNVKDTAKNNANYFHGNEVQASAHYFVDDNNIYQSVRIKDQAWHCGCRAGYKNECRNENSVGIEMCTSWNYTVSTQTQINTAFLTALLCKKFNIGVNEIDTYVVRHYDVVASNKQCPLQYVKNPNQWTQFKNMVKEILNTGTLKINNQQEDDDMASLTQQQFNSMMNQYLADLAKQPADDWALESIKWAVDNGIIADANNTMPRKLVTREEVAAMLQRAQKLK